MKKLTLLLFSLLLVGFAFQSCTNSGRTYAELQADEEKAIKNFIGKNNIEVINTDKFKEQDSTTTTNQYVLLSDGVYMHVDKKGGSLAKNNDVILTRFLEENVATGDSTLSNYYDNTSVDQFTYKKTTTSSYGVFTLEQSQKAYMLSSYGSAVPEGWLIPLQYVGDGAKVKVIVPSGQGHSTAQQTVTPYFYEIEYKIY